MEIILYIKALIFISFFLISKKINTLFDKSIAIKYITKCLNNPLKEIFFSSFIEKPNISIIIPVYNCQSTIVKVIESIHCQNFSYYEIILVNDFSTDNTSNIIDSLQKKDKRTVVIKNKKNMGILYSRCIAALNTKGIYIFPLDNDDLIFNPNILQILYDKATKNNYDIIGFNSYNIHNYNFNLFDLEENFFNHQINNLIIYQPQLGIFPISKNDKYYENDFQLWGKLILTKLYKRAVNKLGIKRYSIINNWTEDISISIIIFNLAESYCFLKIP